MISAVAVSALDLQPGIAKAAKEVGVKLFVPSEFGGPTTGPKEGPLAIKANIQEQLSAIGRMPSFPLDLSRISYGSREHSS